MFENEKKVLTLYCYRYKIQAKEKKMKKLENLGIYIDHVKVKGTDNLYDVKITTVEGTRTFYSLKLNEVNAIYKGEMLKDIHLWKMEKGIIVDEI